MGEPRALSLKSFKRLFRDDQAIRSTVARIGMPDRAEIQRVYVDQPWVSYEIRTYYRDYNRMFAYGRAFILDNPGISLIRYEGPIPDGKFQMAPAPVPMDPLAGLEESVVRAEDLADRAELLADRAELAADRLEGSFEEGLVKN